MMISSITSINNLYIWFVKWWKSTLNFWRKKLIFAVSFSRVKQMKKWHNPNTWISHLVYAKAKIEGESLKGQDTKIKFHTHSSSTLPVYGSLKDLIQDVWSSMLKFGELFESFLGTFWFFWANKIFRNF